MIRGLAYVAVLAAAPVLAQDVQTEVDPTVFADCLDGGIGGVACPNAKLARNLGLLAAEDMFVFSDKGGEGFAMLTALRYAASALFFIDEGEPCIAEEERTAAVDIWYTWVKKPDDLLVAQAADFDVYAALMDGVAKLEVVC